MTTPYELKACIYARESTSDRNLSPPIEEQVNRAKEYINSHNMELINVYIDNGYSGGDWNRPDFKKLLKQAKGHLFKNVIVWNTDRIARDTELFLYFQRNLKDLKIKIISITEGEIDMDSVGNTAKNISIAMAHELFRKITSEKVKKAYDMKKRESVKKGVPVKWGRKTKKVDVEKIFELRGTGLGYKTIAKTLGGGISYQKVRRVLQNTPPENQNKNTKLEGNTK